MLSGASNFAEMHNTGIAYYVALLLLAVTSTNSTKCSRTIEGTTGPRSYAEGKYHLFMTLFNRTEKVYAYMPNTRYSVVLQADDSDQMHRKFTRFLISAEPENVNETSDVGTLDLQDDALTKFADNCANAIVETSKVGKEEISVAWTSPSEGSGCVLIRATVMETADTWYMDELSLMLNMCQDSKAEADDQGTVLAECCACDEAKYEVTFEGLWSRNTHPKDFPSKGWLIRFSDVIGASHTGDYRFWQYSNNGIPHTHTHAYMASTGLQQVAEAGTTRKLESELKDRSEHIRTIIKARGIAYPNVTGRTFAVFRVDRKHHLMSLVSKIDPSPDWIVGVSGLELCLPNCSWIIHKEYNLYPYDAGTDDGISYLSPDSPTDPPEPIRRITSTYPNDSRSPFYDPSGLDMKPLAKLYLNRQRLYEKTCDDGGDDTLADADACKVTSWGEWSMCSVTCGRGTQLRQRHFRDEAAANANKCITTLTDRKHCYNAESPHCTSNSRHDGLLNSEKCELTQWSAWSSCSSTCGEGSRTRSRNFRLKKYRKQCKAVPNGPALQQSIDCENEPCEGEEEEVRQRENYLNVSDEGEDYVGERADNNGEIIEQWLQKCPADRYTEWTIWSPCSSSCGPGVKLRSRLHKGIYSALKDDSDSHEECKVQQASCVAEIPSCDFSREEAEKICSEPMEKGRCNSNILRAYFDKQSGRCHLFSYSGCDGNRNNFPTEQDCNNVCGNFQKRADFRGIQAGSQIMESSEKVNCQVSEWSKWSRCDNCRGFTISIRTIMTPAQGGGKSCPKKLLRKKKCHRIPPCSLQGDGTGRRYHRDKNSELEREISVNCKVTPWSTWSKCSATCGEALRTRVRSIMVQPRGSWAKLCPNLAEFRKCSNVDCPQ
ncbi:spondin-1 isoform X3 [Cataglyphis hispanica]|uniref:spondin-1 isoform X3 n=1 Tax=Cataglyphis hispanica TaxID=1086592 RepID=UPI00217F23C8|nr:spondin-1 isoform X3 [Cataglyphis hispanica]